MWGWYVLAGFAAVLAVLVIAGLAVNLLGHGEDGRSPRSNRGRRSGRCR